MDSIYLDVRRRGGVASTWELLRDGHTSHQLTAAVHRGEIVRARQGHYACPELDEAELQAVRVGGRLTGLAGARRHGIWTPIRASLELTVAPDARALRSPTNKSVRLRSSAATVCACTGPTVPQPERDPSSARSDASWT